MSSNNISTEAAYCPLCAKNGKKNKILPFQINLTESIFFCSSAKCTYPFSDHFITAVPCLPTEEQAKINSEIYEANKDVPETDESNKNKIQIIENIPFTIDLLDNDIFKGLDNQNDSFNYSQTDIENVNNLVNDILSEESNDIFIDDLNKFSSNTELTAESSLEFTNDKSVKIPSPNKEQVKNSQDSEESVAGGDPKYPNPKTGEFVKIINSLDNKEQVKNSQDSEKSIADSDPKYPNATTGEFVKIINSLDNKERVKNSQDSEKSVAGSDSKYPNSTTGEFVKISNSLDSKYRTLMAVPKPDNVQTSNIAKIVTMTKANSKLENNLKLLGLSQRHILVKRSNLSIPKS